MPADVRPGRTAGVVAFVAFGIMGLALSAAWAAPVRGGRPRWATGRSASADTVGIEDFPLETGRTWSYQVTWTEGLGDGARQETGEIQLAVLNHHELGPANLITLLETTDIPGSERQSRLVFCLSDGRVIRRVYDATRLSAWMAGGAVGDDGTADLVFPLHPGLRWGPPEAAGNPAGHNTHDAGAFVDIELPAGPFRALPVRFTTRSDREISWLASGVGVVRYEYRHFGQQSRELWEMKSTRMAAPDTTAIGQLIQEHLAVLMSEPGFSPRRPGLAGDPTLRALLGPLAQSETLEDDDASMRLRLRGEGSLLTIESIPDGRKRAWIGRWMKGARLLDCFFLREGGAGEDAGRPPLAGVPDRSTQALRSGVEAARQLMREAARAAGEGRPTDAAVVADLASRRLVDGLVAGIEPGRGPGRSVDENRERLAQALGADWLVTRYGRRLRLDDGLVTIQIDDGGDLLLPTIRIELPGQPPIGGPAALVRSSRVTPEPSGIPGLAIRRVMALDWSELRPGHQCLLRAESAEAPGRIELFLMDESAAEATAAATLRWRKSVARGSVRWNRESPLLDVTEIESDVDYPAVWRAWREEWSPGESDQPVMIRRERLNPWLDGVVDLLRALRAKDGPRLGSLVPDEALRAGLEGSWLARPGVELVRVESDPDRLEDEPMPAVIGVTLTRRPGFVPDNSGPDQIRLRLAPGTGIWPVIGRGDAPGTMRP